MKKVILLAACLFAISTAVNAQETPRKDRSEKVNHGKANKEKMTPEQRAQKNVDNLNAIASLTEDQKMKVKELATTRITKADAIRTKYKGQEENKDVAKKEISAVQKEYRQSVKALLTPEQIEKVKAKKKEGKSDKDAENIIDAND
jgi:periplasmic protein CpxP/Spy